jgi:putative exporter of polyketide antibiotics
MADTPKEPESPYVKLAGAIGGSAAGIFFIAALFGGGQLWPAAAATGALAFLGIGLAYFISKPR